MLAHLGPSPQPEDELIRDLGLDPAAGNAALALLELEGRILRAPGGLISHVV
jgi:DNA processing protein